MYLAQQRTQLWTPLKITRLMKLRVHLNSEELIDELCDRSLLERDFATWSSAESQGA